MYHSPKSDSSRFQNGLKISLSFFFFSRLSLFQKVVKFKILLKNNKTKRENIISRRRDLFIQKPVVRFGAELKRSGEFTKGYIFWINKSLLKRDIRTARIILDILPMPKGRGFWYLRQMRTKSV